MKKVIFAICMACTFGAFAANEESVTSREYVDAGLGAKQDTLTTTGAGVMTFDSTQTDGIGQKPIYNPNGDYVAQADALVTASTANIAIQNAIAAEFVCIAWKNDDPNDECLLVQIKNSQPQPILPNVYTALEYIESTGTQYIDTNINWNSVTRFVGKAQQDIGAGGSYNLSVLGGTTNSSCTYTGFFGTAYWGSQGGIREWYWGTGILPTVMANFDIYVDENNDWAGYVNNVPTNGGSRNLFSGKVVIMGTKTPNGAICQNRRFKGKVWYIKLVGTNGNNLFNGIPARRNSDGELGLYDLVSGTFFTNAGDGEFVAGPLQNVYLPTGNQ
ncbi:MAG: hypothetical protein J6T57_03775 [Alphaproteobacteria bacterium]|nr:hypothetical protein [Alphaproteobacteria bacterium]